MGCLNWYKVASGVVACAALLVLETFLFTSVGHAKKYKIYLFQFSIVFNIVLFPASKYLWKRLVVEIINGYKLYFHFPWKLVVITFLILAHFAPFTNYLTSKEPSFLNMLSWSCFAAYIQLLLVLWLLLVLVWILYQLLNLSKFNIDRHKQSSIAVVMMLVLSFIQFNIATGPPTIHSVEIPIAKLPNSMNDFRIALLADIHVGPTVGFSQVDRIVKLTNNLNPDLIVLAGDLMDVSVNDADGAALPLNNLKAPFGKYYVTGNHEYYIGDVRNWFDLVIEYGFTVLHNSNKKIYSTSKEDWFCLIGTDDIEANQISYYDHGMDLDKAYIGCDEEHAAILIAHQPKAVKQAIDSKYDLQLALTGHTHGGQTYPLKWFTYLVNPFFKGLYFHNGSFVYVTQGSAYHAFPFRLGSHPEITHITLKTVNN